MKDIEIEIKVSVEHEKPLLDFLEKNGELVLEKRQIDEYFSPSHKSFLDVRPVSEWLRLRNADGKFSINYKNWYTDESGKGSHCDEYETAVEDLKQARQILEALKFKSIVKVDKLRRSWLYKGYEISVDSVKNLGDFVEIEYKGKDKEVDPKRITNEMVAFLKNVGCGELKRDYRGYPFLLLFPDEGEYEVL